MQNGLSTRRRRGSNNQSEKSESENIDGELFFFFSIIYIFIVVQTIRLVMGFSLGGSSSSEQSALLSLFGGY
jgi:hypothetical protein